MVNVERKLSGLVSLGVATVSLLAFVGCDVIWGVHAAKPYLPEGGTGGTPTTGSMGGDGGSSTTTTSSSGTVCTPLAPHVCTDPGTLERCNSDGSGYEQIVCAPGCGETPSPHCKLAVPSGLAPVTDFDALGLADTTLGTANTLHTDTGEIEGGLRSASVNPMSLSVKSGVGFHVVSAGGNTVGVFVFGKLDVTGSPLKIVGAYPAVLLAKSDVSITRISVAADQITNTPGPGGFAGGTPSVPDGLGLGGGTRGGFLLLAFWGGGGGGHGDRGGDGATLTTILGGMGGASYDDITLTVLRGGSGGGAVAGGTSNGGGGGGAVQIVSQSSIHIAGGVAAGGAGGRGHSDNSCGGGGAGGAILLEAPIITVGASGFLIAGGGGGGGLANGNAAVSTNLEAGSGLGGLCDMNHRCGGQGAYSAQTFGGSGQSFGSTAGCGGGGVGRIRLNTLTGAALLSMTNTLYVPATDSSEFTQGVVTIQ